MCVKPVTPHEDLRVFSLNPADGSACPRIPQQVPVYCIWPARLCFPCIADDYAEGYGGYDAALLSDEEDAELRGDTGFAAGQSLWWGDQGQTLWLKHMVFSLPCKTSRMEPYKYVGEKGYAFSSVVCAFLINSFPTNTAHVIPLPSREPLIPIGTVYCNTYPSTYPLSTVVCHRPLQSVALHVFRDALL